MQRSLFLLCLLASVPALALTRPPRPGDRIGVLRISDRYAYGAEQTVANTIQNDLRRELGDLGFGAFDAQVTYDDLSRSAPANADFYVEIVSSRAANQPVAGVGTGTRGVAVEVAVVVSRVAAEVRLYDGRTLDLLERYDLQRNKTAVVPTAIGIGGRSLWAYIALPFIHHAQYRAAAHEVARDAADRIAGR